MTDNQSLRADLEEELTNDLAVSVCSVLLALLGASLYSQFAGYTVGGYFLLITIGVHVPYAYERHWPVSYATAPAVVWTISAALITMGLFMGAYQLSLRELTAEYAAGVAYLVTVVVQYEATALFRRVRQHA